MGASESTNRERRPPEYSQETPNSRQQGFRNMNVKSTQSHSTTSDNFVKFAFIRYNTFPDFNGRSPPLETSFPEFDKPWRKTPWGEKERLEKDLREIQLNHPNVKYVRILLTGDVGAGKSSFINSINSAFQKRITTEALASNSANKTLTFTKTYKTYCIKSGESILPFVFNDVMGLEADESRGVQPEDIVKAIQGCLKEGYKFNPASPVSTGDEGYRSDPSPQEQTYCLVYIIATDKISMMKQDVIKKIQNIRAKASELDIPQVIIMTKVDEACPLVKEDLRKIYTSKKIKQKMEECSAYVGVPVSHIFPVKNYNEEIDPDDDIDVLLLRALTHIVNAANDKLAAKLGHAESLSA